MSISPEEKASTIAGPVGKSVHVTSKGESFFIPSSALKRWDV
jgi:hypothetical protein